MVVSRTERLKRLFFFLFLSFFFQAFAEASGQGVAITGDKPRETWDWANSVIFAATIVTTIG